MGIKQKFTLFLKKVSFKKKKADKKDIKIKNDKKVKVKEVKKGKYKSIKGSMMIAYCIPVALIVILGTTSYRTASKVVVEKYETSVASTMQASGRYLDIVCTEIRNKASSLATDKKLANYFSSLYAENNTESKTLYNDYYVSLSNYMRSSDFLSDYYIIANTGNPLLSNEKTEQMRRTIRKNAFLEFWDQEDAAAFKDESIKNVWVGYHPFIDKEYIGDKNKYAVSYVQPFPHKDGVVILDISMDNIKDFIFNVNGFDIKASYFERSIDEIFIPVLRKWTEMNKEKDERFIIFLVAPPAVGKTTLSLFLEHLSKSVEGIDEVQAIGLDGFHFHSDYIRSHSVNIKGKEIPMSEVKGCLETFDIEKLKAKLKELEKKNVMWPIYDRNIHDVVENSIFVNKKIVLIEGNWLLADEEKWRDLKDFCNYSIFIYADEDLLKERLI